MAEATQLHRFWYAVARSQDVARRPIERRVNGRTLVLFRDGAGGAAALDARCPHRGANLAQGTIRDGCVVCPYHGWRFDGAGRCVTIPANPDGRHVPAGFGVTSFATLERQGFVWVCLAASAVAPPPRFAALEDASLHAFWHEEVVPVPFDWWVENALDLAHVPFVHRETYGGQAATVAAYPVERRADRLGFSARASTNHRYSLFARLLHRTTTHFEMRLAITHEMPGSTVFDIDLGRGKRQVLIFLATPEDGRSTRMWVGVLRNYLKVPFGDAVGRWFLRKVVREDVAMAQRSLALVGIDSQQLSVAADEPSLEFLRLLRHWRAHERAPDATDSGEENARARAEA